MNTMVEAFSPLDSSCGQTTEGRQLYGRAEEEERLLEAYYRCTSSVATKHQGKNDNNNKHRQNEIVLVTGKSGTGKTALANTLRKPVAANNGCFITGKFDQLQKPEPYAPFVSAFTEYTHLIMEKGNETTSLTKQAILNSLGLETNLVADMIPALELIVGSQCTTMNNDSATNNKLLGGAQKRHETVFCKFVKALCSYDRPMVLLIDDLQWSDVGSLELLEALITDKDIKGLLILGTCRHDEVPRDHRLSMMLRKLEDERILSITNITCTNLSWVHVNELVSSIVKQPASSSESFSDIVYEETNGNIFYVLQFLKNLYENDILYENDEAASSKWLLDEHKLQSIRHFNDVVDLLVKKIERLPSENQEVLMIASCIGTVFDEYLLFEILPSSNVEDAIETAVEAGCIIPVDGGYRFSHDKIQQAAYSLVPVEERDAFHLNIGRHLLDNLPSEELDINIFTIVNQLKHGVCLMGDQNEKNNLASLCLRAGERAATSSDFIAAASYSRLGIDLLGSDHWIDQYFISLDMYNFAAEMEYCNANFEEVDTLSEVVLSNARILRDKVRAYTTQIWSYGARQEFGKAVDKAFEVLNYLGQPLPPKPRKIYVIHELMKTRKMLKKKTDEELLKLRVMHEWEKLGAMQILNILYIYIAHSKDGYMPFIALRMVQLTLQYGQSTISSFGFALYGALNIVIGNIDEGYRFGQLALAALEKNKVRNWLPRVYCCVYALIFIWKKPLRESIDPLRQAHLTGLQTGDFEISMIAAYVSTAVSIWSGQRLEDSVTDVKDYIKLMGMHKQEQSLQIARLYLQVMLNFMGYAKDSPFVLSGDICDEELIRQSESLVITSLLDINKAVLAYYFQNYKLAFESAQLVGDVSKTGNRGTLANMSHTFYSGLTCLALARQDKKKYKHGGSRSGRKRYKKYMKIAKKALEQLSEYSLHCPENFLNKVLLMEAEFSITVDNVNDVDVSDAMSKYDESIEQAKLQGLQHEHALAYERAGILLLHFGGRDDQDDVDNITNNNSRHAYNADDGHLYLSKAYSLYDEWGAYAKVQKMREMYDFLN